MPPRTQKVWEGNAALRRLVVEIDSLAPHPQNPRVHDLPAIRESLREFGQQRPVLVVPPGRIDPTRATIIAGHGTTAAAAEEGWTHIAIVTSDLSDADIDRYLAADNRTSDLGTYDDRQLLGLLGRLDEVGYSGTGYQHDDLAELRALLDHDAELERAERASAPSEQPAALGTAELFRIQLTYDQATYAEVIGNLDIVLEARNLESFSDAVKELARDAASGG
jgi:hypothetical protein